MFGHAQDAVAVSLIAAALVVLAHVTDAVSQRRHPDGDGWGHSLALALCGLAAIGLVIGATLTTSPPDLLIILATGVAVAVSMFPLVGSRDADGARERPSNPWDRAYRVQPARVAQLLAPARRRPAPLPTSTDTTPREGVVLGPTALAPEAHPSRVRSTRPSQSPPAEDPAAERRPATNPDVREAEETLQDVSEVVDDLGRLLGLHPLRGDQPDQR